MRFIKDNLSVMYNDIVFYTSTSNEDNTEGDIDQMGENLAREIKNFIDMWIPEENISK